MFYGTITANGTISTQNPYSNNFTCSRVGEGEYLIYLHQWTGAYPTALVTPTTHVDHYTAMFEIFEGVYGGGQYSQHTSYTIKVRTNGSAKISADCAFTFSAMCGSTLCFCTDFDNRNLDLEITPAIKHHGSQKILTLSANVYLPPYSKSMTSGKPEHGSTTASIALESETVLQVIATDLSKTSTLNIKLTESTLTELSDPEVTWNLAGYTYSTNRQGKGWSNNPDPVHKIRADSAPKPQTSLSLDPLSPTSGSHTTRESFVVVAVKQGNGISDILTSDPIIRLSSVPPAGMTLIK